MLLAKTGLTWFLYVTLDIYIRPRTDYLGIHTGRLSGQADCSDSQTDFLDTLDTYGGASQPNKKSKYLFDLKARINV